MSAEVEFLTKALREMGASTPLTTERVHKMFEDIPPHERDNTAYSGVATRLREHALREDAKLHLAKCKVQPVHLCPEENLHALLEEDK